MDAAEQVLAYIKVLVWPLTTMTLVLLFRSQVRNLIDGISEFTGPGNLSFKRRVAAVHELALEVSSAQAAINSEVVPPHAPHLLAQYLDLVEEDPEGAIKGTWGIVRSAVRDATHELGTDRNFEPGALTVNHVRSLVPLGLPEDMVSVARQLSGLRNDVVHGRRLRTTPQNALDYVAAAESLLMAVARTRASKS